MFRFFVCFSFLTCIVTGFAQDTGVAQDTATRKQPSNGGQIELFLNSSTMSQALAINAQGSVIGIRETPDPSKGQLIIVPFYIGKYGSKDIPPPNSFTNLEPIGICDTDLVVGYASRPPGSKDGSLAGVVWDPKTETFAFLPKAPGDVVNQPQAISADGKRITGYTTGPDRLRPALWVFDDSQKEWTIKVLSTLHENNPYLMSGGLMISPDGKRIAGCCTEAFRPDGNVDSALFLWTETEPDRWERKLLSSEQLYLRGINDQGEMAGSVRGKTGERQPCFVSPQGDFRLLELLPKDVSGEAKGINNDSVIVGFSDDPIGGDGGPEPCFWKKDAKPNKIAPAGSWFGMIQAINQAGQMAGLVEDSQSGASLAFRTLRQ